MNEVREKIPTFVLLTVLLSSIVLVAAGFGKATATKIRIEPTLIDNQDMSMSTIQVDVTIENVEDLYGWGVCLKFAPLRTVLAYYETTGQADFLSGPGVSVFVPTPYENVAEGTLYIGATRMMDVPGVSGSGKLATVTFNVLQAGESPIEIVDSTLVNSDNEMIPHHQFDGYYQGPVAQLVRKELPLGRDISLAEGKKQIFLSAVKNFAEVPLYVKTKIHMVRDDGKVTDMWTGIVYLGCEALDDTTPVTIDAAASYQYSDTTQNFVVEEHERHGTSPYLDAVDYPDNYLYIPPGTDNYVTVPYTDSFTGDGATTVFPLTYGRRVYNVEVYVDGVLQVSGVDYTVLDSTTAAKIQFLISAPGAGANIIVNYKYRQWNYIGVFTFEDTTIPFERIQMVEVEFYAQGDGDDDIGYGGLRFYDPDTGKWIRVPDVEPSGWGWYGKDVTGVLDTAEKINDARLIFGYDPDGAVNAEQYIDAVRLKLTIAPSLVQPGEVLEMDPIIWTGLTMADIGTYTCEAFCYFSYDGIKFNPATRTSTFRWWVTE